MIEKISVFISYSRKDASIAETIARKLNENSIETLLDSEQIDAGEEWQKRLSQLISQAHAVLFLVSENSVKSEVCSWEVKEADYFAKRIFPIVIKCVDTKKIPQEILKFNLTFLDNEEKYELEFNKIVTVLKKDTSWHRQYAHLCEIARLWREGGREKKLLIRGQSVRDFERLLRDRPLMVPENFKHVNDFLDAASELEQSETDWKRKIIQRGFVNQTYNEVQRGFYDSAVRHLAAAAILSGDLNFELEQGNDNHILRNSLWRSGAFALFSNKLANRLFISNGIPIQYSILGENELKLAAYNENNEIFIWCLNGSDCFIQLETSDLTRVNNLLFFNNDKILISSHHGGEFCVWSTDKGGLLHKLNFDFVPVFDFDPNKNLFIIARSFISYQNANADSFFIFTFDLESGIKTRFIKHDPQLSFDSVKFVDSGSVVILKSGFAFYNINTSDRTIRVVNAKSNSLSNENIQLKVDFDGYDAIKKCIATISCFQEKFTRESKVDSPVKILYTAWNLDGNCSHLNEINLNSPYIRLIKKVGQYLLICAYDLIIKCDFKSGTEISRLSIVLGHNPLIVVDRTEKIALVANQNKVVSVDIHSLTIIDNFSGHTGPINCINLSSKSDFFISSATSYVQPGSATNEEFSDLAPRKYVLDLNKPSVVAHINNIWCCSFLSKTGRVIAGSPNNGFFEFCPSMGIKNEYKLPSGFTGPYEISCFVSDDENEEIFGIALDIKMLNKNKYYDAMLCKFNRGEYAKIQLPDDIVELVLDGNSLSIIYATSSGGVFLYDLARAKIDLIFSVSGKVAFINLCTESKNIIVFDEDKILTVYSMVKAAEISRTHLNEMNFDNGKVSCCGKRVVCASGDYFYFFELDFNGKYTLYHKSSEQTNFMGGRPIFEIHPKGHIAYSANWFRDVIFVWDMSTGALISKLPGNTGVYSFKLDTSNNILYVASKVGLLKWDLSQFDCLMGEKIDLIIDRLKSGRGYLSFSERRNVLFSDLPDSLLDYFYEGRMKRPLFYE